MLRITLFVLAAAASAHGFLGGSKTPYPDWDKLSVTFKSFFGMPMSAADATSAGWKKIGDGCTKTRFFLGQQYSLNNGNTLLLFDKLGQIAGIQFRVPKTMEVAKNRRASPFVADDTYLYMTAYFTDLANICSDKQVRNPEVVGDKLFIQTSAKRDLMEIPLKETDVLAKTPFVKGKCFYGMGQHYWYAISNDMDCEDFYPVFLLYNGGELNAFGWATAGFLDTTGQTPEVEHPPNSRFGLSFFWPAEIFPKCVLEPEQVRRRLTTQHVYLQRRPYFNFC